MNDEQYEALKETIENDYHTEIRQALERRTEKIKALEIVRNMSLRLQGGDEDCASEVAVEPEGEFIPHRTCRACGNSKPTYEFGHTSGGNLKSKCLGCEAIEEATQLTQTKLCVDCGEVKPLADFSRVPRGSARQKSCKDCQRKKTKDTIEEKKREEASDEAPKIGRPPNPTHHLKKLCSKCKEWVDKTEFTSSSSSADGKHSMCNECRRKAYHENKNKKQKVEIKTYPEGRKCGRGNNCLAYEAPFGSPAILAVTNPGPLCERCTRRAGLA